MLISVFVFHLDLISSFAMQYVSFALTKCPCFFIFFSMSLYVIHVVKNILLFGFFIVIGRRTIVLYGSRFYDDNNDNFLEFESLVFLEIKYDDSLQQCLTSSRGKTHEKYFWGPNLGLKLGFLPFSQAWFISFSLNCIG